jgi:hypothetical protein
MDRDELVDCMHEAAEALAEFRHLVPRHSARAHVEVEAARRHFDHAVTLLRRAARGGGGGGERDGPAPPKFVP